MIVMLMMTKAYDSDVFCLWRCMMEYLFAPCLRLPRWLPLAPKWYADILINLKVMTLVGTFQASPTSTWPPRTAAPSPPWTNSSSVSPLIFQRCVSLFSWSMRKGFSLGSFSFCKSWTCSNGYGKRKRKNGKKEKFWKTRKNPKLCKISYRPPWRSTTWPNGSPNLRPTPPRPWAASSLTLMGN